MQAKWGIAWLVTAIWLFALMWVPAPGLAAGDYAYRSLPILPIEAQSSLETQMLGEKPLPSAGPHFPGISPRSVSAAPSRGWRRQSQAASQYRAQHLHSV